MPTHRRFSGRLVVPLLFGSAIVIAALAAWFGSCAPRAG
jgi:hypothetical protein